MQRLSVSKRLVDRVGPLVYVIRLLIPWYFDDSNKIELEL
jgi:hypothetical protein